MDTSRWLPPALGLRLAEATDLAPHDARVQGWRAARGLDGPPGILQGGLAVGVTMEAMRLASGTDGLPVAVDARLHAPTPLETDLTAHVDGAGERLEVSLHDGDQVLVRSKSTGIEGAAEAVDDLADLLGAPGPDPRPQQLYPGCFVCGSRPSHPLGLRIHPAWSDDETIVTGFRPRPELADHRGVLAPVVVAAALDCPTLWSAFAAIRRRGDEGGLLAGFRFVSLRNVPIDEELRIVARCDAVDGRKLRTRGALFDTQGRVLATSSALHISVAELPGGPR